MVDRVLHYLDEYWPAHLETTRAFVRQPSISADGTGMAEMAALVRDKLIALSQVVPSSQIPGDMR